MDRDGFIELLNGDLQTEYQSIIQYVQHTAVVKGAEYLSAIEELRTHLSQELQHAMVLAEQVDFLGGTPSVDVPEVATASGSRGALRMDLELESQQLERYRDRVDQAGDLGLADVGEALRPLLQQTQDHVRDLRTMLGD
jgi:bacterioferritin